LGWVVEIQELSEVRREVPDLDLAARRLLAPPQLEQQTDARPVAVGDLRRVHDDVSPAAWARACITCRQRRPVVCEFRLPAGSGWGAVGATLDPNGGIRGDL